MRYKQRGDVVVAKNHYAKSGVNSEKCKIQSAFYPVSYRQAYTLTGAGCPLRIVVNNPAQPCSEGSINSREEI